MEKLSEFVSAHISDDTARLILDRGRWPDIDMNLAVSCIESRRKLRGKVQEWYDVPELVFPVRLSAEQCSSSATARYKAELAARIVPGKMRIADLTGGLGVDSWYFSKVADKVLYNEMQPSLCEAARHNFSILKSGNIIVTNNEVTPENSTRILKDFTPDIIYMDPARRAESGRKVFLIEECTPDVLTLREDIFRISRHILLKLSPMADISMVCDRLGSTCREVHVVSSGGECKELLIWMDREWQDGYMISAVELASDDEATVFTFSPSEEKEAAYICWHKDEKTSYLFEPGKSLMKSGAFNLISARFEVSKLGKSTHYYTTDDPDKALMLRRHGKVYRIVHYTHLDKRTIKTTGKVYPRAEVTARNIPMDTDALRKKLDVTSGDDAHIFGLKSDSAGNLLIVTEPCL